VKICDLIYFKQKGKLGDNNNYIGLLVNMEQVGSNKGGSTVLYDVLLTDTNEVITISDIYFKIWRVK
jgi:hypothetical protein